MARVYNYETRLRFEQRRKEREQARVMVPPRTRLRGDFDREMAEAHAGWMAGDDAAKKKYFSMLGKRGGKALKGPLKKRAGRLGGLETKKTQRKEYVKGKQHGNYGKKRPLQLSPARALERLQQEVEYRLKNPEAYRTLTWDPSQWQPPQIPKDTNIIHDGGDILQQRVPRPGEGPDTK